MTAGLDNDYQRSQGAGQHSQGAASHGDQPADWNALRQDVRQLGDVAIERSYSLVEAAREQVGGYVDRRKSDAAQSVADMASALRESGKGLDQQPNVRAFFDSAADGLEQLSGSIRERSFEDFYSDIEAVARRRPAAVAVATFLTGFLAARFIKASAHPAHVSGSHASGGPVSGGPAPGTDADYGAPRRPEASPYQPGDRHPGVRYPV
ncbi:hypothetical protein [uncultured Methylobacterium sp.]|mgnify:CR=1 FL=1|uniref:hypothetical protein n=1 Tax=uncultured Methylobacterium sp. TaxID=157278 RepID=UPI002618091D|nr:hypothetical protein [uncultured Methylobacterium sp.]